MTDDKNRLRRQVSDEIGIVLSRAIQRDRKNLVILLLQIVNAVWFAVLGARLQAARSNRHLVGVLCRLYGRVDRDRETAAITRAYGAWLSRALAAPRPGAMHRITQRRPRRHGQR